MIIYVTQLSGTSQPNSVMTGCALVHIYKICDTLEPDFFNRPYCVNRYGPEHVVTLYHSTKTSPVIKL